MTSRPGKILTLWQGVEFLSPRDLPKLEPPDAEAPFAVQTYDLYRRDALPWESATRRIFADDLGRCWKHILYVGMLERRNVHAGLEVWRQGAGVDYAGLREGDATQTAMFAVVVGHDGVVDPSTLELAEFPWLLGQLKPDRFSVPTMAGQEIFKSQTKMALIALLTEQPAVSMQQLAQAAQAYLTLAGWAPAEEKGVKAFVRCKSVSLKMDRDGSTRPVQTEFCGSFISADLERARVAVEAGRAGKALASYLDIGGREPAKRIDVDAEIEFSRAALAPQKLPPACWPTAGKHPLVLAQQQAVNLAVESLGQQDGLFSINGPPGTGKTTLVRDIVAAVVTQRAEVMSQLRSPEDAFGPQLGKISTRMKPSHALIESLTGFELVVASSNNGAVENVSRALPQIDAIDSSWLVQCDYFPDIATRLAQATALAGAAADGALPSYDCWAHMTATLGNASNNRRFWGAFWESNKEGAPNMSDWLLEPSMDAAEIKKTWRTALEKFSEAKKNVADRMRVLQDIADVLPILPGVRRAHALAQQALHQALLTESEAERGHRQQIQAVAAATQERMRMAEGGRAMQAAAVHNQLLVTLAREQQQARVCAQELERLKNEVIEVHAALARSERNIAEIRDDERRMDKQKPWFFVRWFRPNIWNDWIVCIKNFQVRLDGERLARKACEEMQSGLERAQGEMQRTQGEIEARRVLAISQLPGAEQALATATAQATAAGFEPNERWEDFTEAHVEAARTSFAELRERCVQANRLLEMRQGRYDDARIQSLQAQSHADWAKNEMQRCEDKFCEAQELLGVNLPDDSFWSQDDAQRHLAAPWAHQALHDSRAALFLAALQLHKAFILGARQKIRKNIACLKDALGRSYEADATVWQSLWSTFFLITPLVSTTYASMGRLFAELKERSIGWLILDEAGQASPQEPVGGLWRSRRALVVGDPMQLPPISKIDSDILTCIGERMGVDAVWNPGTQSAQLLADRASIYGSYVDLADEKTWVGCPLRVHRRCLDPMFRIANIIAYEGRMVTPKLGEPPVNSLGRTRWIDIPSVDADDHYVPQEGQAALDMVEDAFAGTPVGVPSLFVITPFAHVKKCLHKLFASSMSDPRARAWIKGAVGTVHAFQGKEADAVIIVLGGHPDRAGALRWASRTPNLLNVAVTRARKQLYVVGDRSRWRDMEHYAFLARSLSIEMVGAQRQLAPCRPSPPTLIHGL